MTVTTSTRRCALYRHFDHAGVLLYVGISESLVARGKQHARDSEWVRFATRAEATWYPTRSEADAAERYAIRAERPVFNRQHNGTKIAEARRSAYLSGHADSDSLSTIMLDADGGEWWSRRIHIEIDGAARLTLNRDSFVDWMRDFDHGPWELCGDTEEASRMVTECSRAGLAAVWATGHWRDRSFIVSACDRSAHLYVPAGMVGDAADALIAADTLHDYEKIVHLTSALRRIVDLMRDVCRQCAVPDRLDLTEPYDVVRDGPGRALASYLCRFGHSWTRGYAC